MADDTVLRDKLRKIEALFAGAATPGEKAAAGAAAERIRLQLKDAGSREVDVEFKFSLADPARRVSRRASTPRIGAPCSRPTAERSPMRLRA